MSRPIRHIVVIRFSALGDVAMTVPVIRALATQHPSLKITVVSRPFFSPLFEGIPHVEFFEADLNGRHKGLFGIFRLFADLKKLSPDALVDLHDVLRSQILRKLFSVIGIRTAVTDKARAEKKALTRPQNKIFKALKPVVQRHAETFGCLGLPVNLSEPEYPYPAKLSADFLHFTGPKEGQHWIGIAPFAQHQGKVYPQDLLKEVIHQLAKEGTYTIFLFGAADETNSLQTLQSRYDNVRIVAGKFSFADELALISNLDIMLSMDSGNAHLAALFGVKTVTLWGATHPYAGFAPFGQPDSNFLTSDRGLYPLLPTSVYGNKQVEGYHDAMRTIRPEKVVEKVKSLL